MTNSNPRIVVALDYAQEKPLFDLLSGLDPKLCRVKIGKELFTHFGPQMVERVQKLGFDVFLDLKFHDIPNTTAQAVKAAAGLGVWMVNVHALGGRRMLEMSRQALESYSRRPLLVAVTVLTSMQQEDLIEVGLNRDLDFVVQNLANLAKECNLDGVVCSAQEASVLRRDLGSSFELVTPGIRPEWSDSLDQRRIATPVEALTNGSSYLVIGRPITKANDALAALLKITQEIEGFM